MFHESDQGINLQIKVIPHASQNQIVGWENDKLKIRIRAVPENGRANEMLISFLAETLNIPKSLIFLTRGETSRHKQFCFKDISKEELEKRLQPLIK